MEMINNNQNYFDPNDHLFLTPSTIVEQRLGHYSNVCLFDYNGRNMGEIINFYSKFADWIISHGMINHVYSIKRKNLNKVVWRTWGGSRQKSKWDNHHIIKSLAGQFLNLVYYSFYRYSYGCSPVIGVANTVDVLDLEQWNWHKKSKLFFLNYWGQDFFQIIHNTHVPKKDNRSPIRFMVGHQGCPGEHHVEIVRRILSYNEGPIEIYLPLSYGNQDYINKVKEELSSFHDERIHVLDSFFPLSNYVSLLASMDLAVIDEVSSMALGNINILLYFRKKILLNNKGIIRKAFDRDHLPYGLCDSIGTIPYSELVEPVKYEEPLESDIAYQPYEKQINDWKEMFNYLDRLKENG